MTNEQRALVRESWLRCQPVLRGTGARFYERLFALDPAVRQLFGSTDMARQQRKLIAMLTEIVAQLDRPEALVPEVSALGERHRYYGVKPVDYETAFAALLWALEHELGDAFTPAVREAWTEAYRLVATLMRRGAMRASAPVEAPNMAS